VPRLTLLFFGAAKEVPEAARMVTAGQPGYIPTCKPKAKRDTALVGAAAPKEVNHQRNHRYD
jgi:hypothetical protein